MSQLPRLVRLPISHFSRKAAWALDHAGIPYETRDVWFRELIDFRHANPAGTVPILELEDRILCGSHHIVAWAAKENPDTNLYPSAEVREHERWCDEVLGPWAQREAYRTLHARPFSFGRNPGFWLAGLVGKPLILGILKHYKARRHEEADRQEAAARFTQASARLREGPFLFGDHVTAADIAQATLIEPLLRCRKLLPDHPDRALLAEHVKRVKPKSTCRRRRRASKADHARWAGLVKIEEGEEAQAERQLRSGF